MTTEQIEQIKKLLKRMFEIYPVPGTERSDNDVFYNVEDSSYSFHINGTLTLTKHDDRGWKVTYWEDVDFEKLYKCLKTFVEVQEEIHDLRQQDIKFDADSLNNQN
jgi:hypothetical protein